MALLKSTKEDVRDWIKRNGAKFGLVTENKIAKNENPIPAFEDSYLASITNARSGNPDFQDDIKSLDVLIAAERKDHTGAFAGLNDIEIGVDYKKTVASPV